MAAYLDTLRSALNDPELEGITCFAPDEKEAIVHALQKFPEARYVSEWRYEVGSITYRYHVHNDAQLGEELQNLCKEGKTSRHPKLTDVFKVSELETILTDPVHADSH